MSRRLPAFFRSLRWRVQALHGLLLAAVLAGLGVAAWRVEARARMERLDDSIQSLAFDVNSTTRRRPMRAEDARARPPSRPIPRIEDVFTDREIARGYYYVIWRKNDEPRFTASPNAPADLPLPPEVHQGRRTRGDYRESFVSPNPGDYALVGISLVGERAEQRRLAWKIAAAGAGLWGAVMAAGWWLVGRALRPARAIAEAAERIAGGDLSRRIEAVDASDELGRLATVLNSTFARLEAAFARQGRFTADAAHELRTPVATILTQAQAALASEELSPEQRESFEACERAARRMRSLIESLLALARLDAGQDARRREPVDLAKLASEAAAALAPQAVARGIKVRLATEPAPLEGDSARLAQVADNLIGNAIQHNREGGEVSIETRIAGGRAELIVTDKGPGIAAEHLPHIFERFYRADPARGGGRSGLGLAISKAVVEAHGGEITAASTPGLGAVFTVRLPRV